MLKYKNYILATCLIGVVVAVGSYFVTRSIQNKIAGDLVSNFQEQEMLLAKNISRALESDIQYSKSLLVLLSHNETIRNGATAECNEKIKSIVTAADLKLGNIGRVGRDGKFRCSFNQALVGADASKLGQYIVDIFNDPEHKPVMSKAIKVPGVSSYVTAIHIPIFDAEGNFDGTLGGAIYLSDIQTKYLKKVTFTNRGSVVLLDQDGTILYHKFTELIGSNINSEIFNKVIGDTPVFKTILEKSLKDIEGIERYQILREGEKIAAYVPVHVLPGRIWVIMVTVPLDDIKAEGDKLVSNNLNF